MEEQPSSASCPNDRLAPPPDSEVYICDGMDGDQVCGKEVLPTWKLCPHCGTKRKKIAGLGSNVGIDTAGVTPVRSGVQVSTSLDDLGNSRAEDSEQTTAKNVPESSPNNTDENTANHEVINLNARDGDGAQDDLISRSQSGTDYMMASSSESNEEFDCPRKGAMKVIDAREAGKEDETLSTAAGDVADDKKQTPSRTDDAEQNTGSNSSHPMKRSNLPTSESGNRLNDDKKRNAPYAAAVKEKPKIQNKTNSGKQQSTNLKDVVQHSDRGKNNDSQESGSDGATTIATSYGKAVHVDILPPKKERDENNAFAATKTPSKSSSKGPTYKNPIMIHFHVIVSKEDFSTYKRSKGDEVIVIFGREDLGGWKNTRNIMREEKVIGEMDFLMTLDVEIEKNLLSGGNVIEYKYAILHGGHSKQPVEFEYLPQKSRSVVNRELRIPSNKFIPCTEWHQYDGIMSREPEGGIVAYFSDKYGKVTGKYYEQLVKRTREAVTAMLPSWDEIKGTDLQCAKNFLEKLDQVCYCAKNNFLNEKLTPDEMKMKEFLEEFIQPAIYRLQNQIGKELKESEAEAGVRLALASSLVYIIQQYGLKFDNGITKAIFHGLLLRPDRETKVCRDYQQLVEVHFPADSWKKSIAGCLLNFMSRMVTKHFIEPMWLLAAPLLHFLGDYIKPRGAPKTDLNHQTTKWWGINEFTQPVDSFKQRYGKDIPVREYIELLSPLFEQDRLLPRTLMSVMSLEHLPYLYGTRLIPMEVCLANTFFFANTMNAKDMEKIRPALETLESLAKTWLSEFHPSDAKELEEKLEELYVQRKLSLDVLNKVYKELRLKHGPVVMAATKLNANVISNLQKLLDTSRTVEEIKEKTVQRLTKTIQHAIDNLVHEVDLWVSLNSNYYLADESYYSSSIKIDYEEVEIYGYLYQVEFHETDTTTLWKMAVDQHIRKRLKMLSPKLQILVFGDVDFSKYPPEVEACFSKAAFDVLETVENSRHVDYGSLFDLLDRGASASKLQRLLSRIFEKSWPKDKDDKPSSDEATVLQHILTWPSFKRYVGLFYGPHRKTDLLSEDCVVWMQTGLSVIDAVIAKLLSGAITVLQLKLLLEEKMKKHCLDLFIIIEKLSGMQNVPESGFPGRDKCMVLEEVLAWRQTELRSFEEYCLRVNHLHGLCGGLNSVELKNLKCPSVQNQEKLMISDFCEPRVYSTELAQEQKYLPRVTYFSRSPEDEEMLDHLWNLRTSIVFKDIWNRSVNDMTEKQSPCDFASVVETWKFCNQQWTKFSEEIMTGQLTFLRVDTIFGYFDKKYDLIEKELALVVPKELAAERRRHIEQYHQLDQYSRGATIMLKLKEEFKLEGDFATAKSLVDMVKDKSKALIEITNELVDSGKQLEEITDERVECLEVFLKHKTFADWLRMSVDGPKEVKVLVDLAMISAEGQGDMEVEKVMCLNAAAIGYAPLIYDLTPEMGFKEFLPLCQAVWHMLGVDPDLPRKFRDTALQLEWLNRVKESHGSVELNALANAQAINAKGIYSVGNLGNNRKTLDGVVELRLRLEKGDRDIDSTGFVSEESERGKWQKLNLQQLNDLQSKLMLVAGKAQEGKKDVDNFVEILDGVTRLGSLYIRICNAGCSLFHHWKAIFYCDPNKPMFVEVEFGKEGKHIFSGSKNDATNGVFGYIFDLCTFMEDCLMEWLEHIAKQRLESYYLNYYTTEQLVILQNELPKINMDMARISKNIYPLLSIVRKDCTLENVKDAMVAAFQRMEDMERQVAAAAAAAAVAAACGDGNEDDKDAEAQEQFQQKKKFLKAMEESGFSQKLAILALKKYGPEKIQEGIMWCMGPGMEIEESDESGNKDCDVDEGSDVDKDNTRQPRMSIQFTGLRLEKTMDSLTANLFEDPTLSDKLESLTKKLGELWRMYQNEMNTSLADYLSVKHLGCTLDQLAAMDDGRVDRSLPGYMTKGKPNLILCSRAEILAVVLSIYMNGNAQQNSLPGIDEVLLCHAATTEEDVELLWRRAEGDARNGRHGKIYCLVHAELLDYDVARKAEQSLDKHSHAAEEIQLVVVCCREQEDRSHIINALNRYRVKVPPVELKEVRAYLQEHLTVKQSAAVKAAAELDPDRCSVRVIKSHRAGVGKSLKVRRLLEQRQDWELPDNGYDGSFLVSIPLHCKVVDPSVVLHRLLEHSLEPHMVVPRIFHIDIAHEVQEGVDYLLFNLLILGSITDREGYVWSRAPTDLYLIETMPLMQREANNLERRQQELQYVHHIFQLLPTLTCWSPTDSMNILSDALNDVTERYTNAVLSDHDQKMDDKEFRSAMLQRPFQYLIRFSANKELKVRHDIPEGTYVDCIRCLLSHCGIRDPSWSELRHFINFLNVQLSSCEESIFCSDSLAPDLPGFLKFVVSFLIQMSKDFATRSLTISEETPEVAMQLLDQDDRQADDILVDYGLKRRWETSPHPYLFFNADESSFTFMGFIINESTGDILEPGTNRVLAPKALPRELYDALVRNKVELKEDFDALPRCDKLSKMCRVLGIDPVHDPDETYELTADNVKKMLAIYMRFRCDIPVIVMGETGCGKTRLIKFMCDLWKPSGSDMKNMILMKVHGGTTARDIERKVKEAAVLAGSNREAFPKLNVQTVLFFDEANTTDAIGMIKEIMCDHTIGGEKLPSTDGLKLIAACNPYRKHSDAMIQRLEHAGLGYHIQAHQTTDKLGRIPMRQLVYRVQSLPQSMLPLVWDFGQLSTEVETLYIRQMVHRYITGIPALNGIKQLEETIARILAASQEFMRLQKDECSFVSLRDVDRALQVMMWFYHNEKEFFNKMNKKATDELKEAYKGRATFSDDNAEKGDIEERDERLIYKPPDHWTRAFILALGVCYHACLQKRREYREFIAGYFVAPCQLENGAQTIEKNINWCQDVFLDEVELGENIARNQALKENLFMMVICIELRIPLFLVGKPGSSKSLAKTIVADAMQGEAARSELFRALKSVHMVSYQCSPLSTPEGIVGTFRQCAKLQEGQDLKKFVSVVVLDEVGLAEDSDRMPLKTLHPLLEDGCEGDEIPAPHKKVGFIGISNWALDPAKMNRGILVQRGVPDEHELEQSAKGICAKDRNIALQIDVLVQPMSKAYLELYESALKIREFFGLRDFYSLIKMIYGFMKRSGDFPTWSELQHAILRNFGGLDDIHPVEVFEKHLQNVDKNQPLKETDPACDSASLIRCSLMGDGLDSESRYLLILTENYAALGLLQHELLKIKDAIIIFGSSFPKDQEYTQVCRNINRIKVCMETGRTVVLLNLENLYESLYDALNQYYVWFGGQRFVDLGLGTQRVKCRVHPLFRLIVVAEKQVVYEKFPIPLINRLEKHFLAMSTMLTEEQMEVAERLSKWATDFTSVLVAQPRSKKQPKPADVFIGYHPDTAASLILQVCHSGTNTDRKTKLTTQQIFDEATDLLLHCAVPEAILRLSNTRLAGSANEIYKKYFEEQCHNNLEEFLKRILDDECPMESLFVQVTTHSRLLLPCDALHLAKVLNINKADVMLEALHAFGTEQQFCRMLREFFMESKGGGRRVLLLQCDSGDVHAELIACARYNIWNEFCQMSTDNDTIGRQLLHVIFIVQLPRIAGGCFVGFQGGKWMSYHIDDLHPHNERMPSLKALKGRSLGMLFATAMAAMDTPDESMEEVKEEVLESVEGFSALRYAIEEPMDIDTMQSEAERERIDDSFEPLDQTQQLNVQEGVTCVKEKAESLETVLDVDSIIRSCLHSAAAMLKDAAKEDALKLRKTHRLQLLMELLNEKHAGEKLSFMSVLRKRLTLLLKDKEETAMSTAIANGWLSNEAASFEAICRAGTFRRALSQYLETRITPLLAGVVAYTDTNANLDMLTGDEDNLWITSMWLHMLNNAEITIIKYKDLQTATQRMELTDFEVKTTGSDGTFFSACLPFSWIIKEQIDSLIYVAKQDASKDTLILVESALHTTALWKVLKKAEIKDKMSEVIRRYLADFVRVVHKPHSLSPDVEYDLVFRDIEDAMRRQYLQERDREQEERNFIDPSELSQFSIPRIHLTYENIRKRLTLFSELVQLWPESIKTLQDSKIPRNMPLDLICLRLLMEFYLIPMKDDLDCVDSRHRWVEKVRIISPIVVRLLESVSDVAQEHQLYRDKFRFTWNRVGAVQLFIEHICLTKGGDAGLSVKRCMPLWTLLTDKTDFKTLESFETVEKFLKTCNTSAADLYFGKLGNCPSCENPPEFPVRLPCDHILCGQCLVEAKELTTCRCRVPECRKSFPQDIEATVITVKKEGKEKYTLYRKCCNAFFMDLVSCFCFTDNSPPEHEVMQKLMGYVTGKSKLAELVEGEVLATQQKTKKMFEGSFDPTPVVRSFLLQLMLKADIDSVHDYLKQYFESVHALVQTDYAQVIELCVLCVQCLEDYHHRQGTQYKTDVERLHFASDLLVRSTNLLCEDLVGIQLDSLEAIACIRYALMETAKWIYQLYLSKKATMEVRRLFTAARQICHQEQLRWPGIYLIRQIARRFGINALKSISELSVLNWVIPEETRGDQKIPDRFVVCGDNYIKLRDLMVDIVLGRGLEQFEEALKAIGANADVIECLVLLAIYREVTATNIQADACHRPPPEVLQCLTDFCMQNQTIKNKDFAVELVGNKLKGCMQARPNQTDMLSELIIHFKILLSNSKNNSLQKPLLDIITAPQSIAHAYLPTMPLPQDDMDDIRAAIASHAGENATFYQCPNGHPYIVGNCGLPMEILKCWQCAAPIGGESHKVLVSNAAVAVDTSSSPLLLRGAPDYSMETVSEFHAKMQRQLDDATQRGHILGQPQKRAPNPERRMSPASTAILRMLLHMSMYLSSLEDPQAVSLAIFPPIQPQDVSKFLLDHAEVDVETIHSATGHSEEDVIVFMHILIDTMLRNEQFVAGLDNSMKLQTKPSRVEWEYEYVNAYIMPALNGMNDRVQAANNRMVNDERLGNSPLLKTIFEVDIPSDGANVENIHEEPSLWRFRSHISLEHLAHALDESMAQKRENENKEQTYPILQLFIKYEQQLRAIRLLPSIIRLHRLLLQKLNRCLDSSDATTMKIGAFLDDHLKDENQRQEMKGLILNDFAYAWDCVRPSLANYAFSGYKIPIDYTQEPVNVDSRLAMLLPYLRGWGLCSVGLIYYLQELQNNFLENYSIERKQTLQKCVDIYDASYAHFVAYHPVHDLQPIILANCNYSLEVGKGTTIEYDFGSMEKQITERFIRGRPRLGIGRMEFIMYREDFTSAAIFAQLRSRIPQEPLPSKAEMERELIHLADVSDLLASLNIAVGYLVSIGGDPEMKILRFMSDTLKMKQPHIATMLETFKLKHVESLWLLLSYLRARIQATNSQDAFENVDEQYREPVPDDLKPKLKLGFQHIQMDSFLMLLYECIVFNMTVKQNVNAEDYIDNRDYTLRDVLYQYMEDSGSNYSILELQALQDDRFPEEIKVKHCISTWLLALPPNRKQ